MASALRINIAIDLDQLGEDDRDYVARQLPEDVREFIRTSIGLPAVAASSAVKLKVEHGA